MTSRPRLTLIVLTLGGMVLGLVADVVAGGVELSPGNIVLAVIMSPLLAAFGGGAVSAAGAAFQLGGLFFWPVWGLLGWRWLKKEKTAWLAALILAWSTQGFFQLLHRLAMVMSA